MSKKTIKIFFLAQAMVAGTGYEKEATLDVDKDTFDRLKKLNLAKEYDSKTDGIEAESGDCGALEAKVATLEEEKTALEEKVTALEEAQAEIAKLTGFVKEAIELPKGQKPVGFKG